MTGGAMAGSNAAQCVAGPMRTSLWLEGAIGHKTTGVGRVAGDRHCLDERRLGELMRAPIDESHVAGVSVQAVVPTRILPGIELRDEAVDVGRPTAFAVLAHYVAVCGQVHARLVGAGAGADGIAGGLVHHR